MSTVILDPEQKALIRQDINEFLHPLSTSWYATRGIPYRRGYLFHGPPGTGKTSLSFALAGLFGLDIYIIPLMDPDLTEAYLGRLFNALPRRCIVLLEDIDTAGVQSRDEDDGGDEDVGEEVNAATDVSKDKEITKGEASVERSKGMSGGEKNSVVTNGETDGVPAFKEVNSTNHVSSSDIKSGNAVDKNERKVESKEASEETTNNESPNPQNLTLTDLARVLLSISKPDEHPRYHHRGGRIYRRKKKDASSSAVPERVSNISLSGLLNVIDGVATHEGRILIMTTNHPEKLDPALIRAGRVDMQVRFTHATQQQIKHLFLRMYQVDATTSPSPAIQVGGEKSTFASAAPPPLQLSEEELDRLASDFAEQLPEQKFAPSDVQGYLLMHKKNPRDAVQGVAAWRDGKVEEIARKAAKDSARKGRA